MRLSEMICVVTGAGGGVGGALVNGLRSAGATVVAVHRGQQSSIMETRPKFYTVKCDLTDENAVQSLVQNISTSIGPIHVWINTAGGFHMGESIEDSTMDVWRHMLSINFITALNCSRAVLPEMKKNRFGRIINFGSFPGEQGMAKAAPYAVSKAAVHTLTKTIWQEGQHVGVSAHAILPATIDTPTNREAMPDDDWSEWVTTQDIANKIIEIVTTQGIERDPAQIIIPLRGSGKPVTVQKKTDILDIFGSATTTAERTEKPIYIPPTPEPVFIPTPTHESISKSDEQIDPVKNEPKTIVEPKDSIEFDMDEWAPKEPESPADEDFVLPDAQSKDLSTDLEERFIVGDKEEVVSSFIQKIRKESETVEEATETIELDLDEWAPKELEASEEEKPVKGLSEAVQHAGKKLQEIFKRKEVEHSHEDDSLDKIDETKDQINPDMASFEMVEHLKIRQQYDKALAMLAIMEEGGAPEDRIQEERSEIHELIYPNDGETNDESEDGETDSPKDEFVPDPDIVEETSDGSEPKDTENEEEEMDLAGYLDRIASTNIKEKEVASATEDKKKK